MDPAEETRNSPLRELLAGTRTIAVVGMKDEEPLTFPFTFSFTMTSPRASATSPTV